MFTGELKVEEEERVTNDEELEPLQDFRNRRTDQKEKDNELLIAAFQDELKILRFKLREKINNFETTNAKPNRFNRELVQNIHHISNQIIQKLCKINELEEFKLREVEDLIS
jgi:hypothetical protein